MSDISLHRASRGISIHVPFARFWNWIKPHPKVCLSAHLARDVGLEPGRGPIGRVELPSEVWAHPRL
ncbi:hypothetical protein [Pseudaestuariivita atlantica]|uniref:Uncharacterized protein n=1 Tax=Pseudaestuariivita atlantica TaxID=1317121 RepID=A0A0L1JTJ3_9RHOB|nr:hypothetical protein [Pseudaestuariivita atlantica]KNG94738.1 hypothetical protein ATO11_04930 [Pseudaestuariivita atlantica]